MEMDATNVKHVVDCTAAATLPEDIGGEVTYHDTSLGQLELDPCSIELLGDEQHPRQGCLSTTDTVKRLHNLKTKVVLNANVLDYLLDHPELIPEEWKGKDVAFWGTLYFYPNLDWSYVRVLLWDYHHLNKRYEWRWYCGWIGDGPGRYSFAAVLPLNQS